MGKRYNMVVCRQLDLSNIPITCITMVDLVFGIVSLDRTDQFNRSPTFKIS